MAARVHRSEVLTSLGVVLMLAALVAAFPAGNSFDPVHDWQTSLTFVLGAAVGGAGIARENAARHARLFRSVDEVIDGDATSRNKLEGWYRGRRVTLTICPASASAVSMGSYTLCLDVLPSGTSWKLRYGRQGGFGPNRWYVSTPEDTKATVRAMVASATFRDRFTEVGAVSAVEAWHPRQVSNVEWGTRKSNAVLSAAAASCATPSPCEMDWWTKLRPSSSPLSWNCSRTSLSWT